MATFEKPAVIIDNGSYCIKAGFSCDNHPVAIFRTVVGRPTDIVGRYGRPGRHYEVRIGDDAVELKEELNLNCPVVDGRIVHWDNMERVWHHIFYRELKVAPEDRAVIMTAANNTPMSEKIKCCEVYFEALNVPAFCIQPQGVYALYSAGLTTGLSVDIGYDTTDICPVYEGGLVKYAHLQTGYAARQILDFLTESLWKRDVDLGHNVGAIIDNVLHNSMHVKQVLSMPRRNYEMYLTTTSGECVEFSQEAFFAAEMFFQPEEVNKVVGKDWKVMALTDGIVESSSRIDSEIRPYMHNGIVLNGGLSVISGLADRLTAELEKKLNKPVNIIRTDESYVATWMGASLYAGILDAQRSFVTKKQFEDHGARIVKNRFL